MRILLTALLSLLIAPALFAKPAYVEPKPDTPLLRRDLVPLDPDTLDKLSRQLTALAARPQQKSPQDLRASAQLIAIATRLSPTNHEAKKINSDLAEKLAADSPGKKQHSAALAYTWSLTDWLHTDPAGEEGKKLAQLILAPLSQIDPAHPSAKNHQPELADTYWKDTVATLDKFGFSGQPTPNNTRPDPPTPPASPDTPFYAAREATTNICYFTYGTNGSPTPRISPFQINLVPRKDGDPLLRLLPVVKNQSTRDIEKAVHNYFDQQDIDLPNDQGFLLRNTADTRNSLRVLQENSNNLAGPLIPLVESLIDGKKLDPNALLLARIDTSGKLLPPHKAWPLLTHLARHAKNKRIIIPASLGEQLIAQAILHQPDFLLENEFLGLENYAQAKPHLFTSIVPGDRDQKASLAWNEVAARKPGGTTTSSYLSKSGVLNKLNEAIQAAPHHFSAQILYKAGSAKQPPRLTKKMGAVVLHGIVEIISEFSSNNTIRQINIDDDRFREALSQLNNSNNELGSQIQEATQALENSTKYFHFDQRTLLKNTETLIEQARKIHRAQKAKKNANKLITEYTNMRQALLKTLRPIAGYPEPPERKKIKLPQTNHPLSSPHDPLHHHHHHRRSHRPPLLLLLLVKTDNHPHKRQRLSPRTHHVPPETASFFTIFPRLDIPPHTSHIQTTSHSPLITGNK